MKQLFWLLAMTLPLYAEAQSITIGAADVIGNISPLIYATSSDQRVNGKYWQDHLPAIEQRTAEGHAVRAMYFYSGMANWVRYSGDKDYETAVTAIWDNIASKKFYITGGFGARDNNEAFGEDYELPNATAYCETCASVAGTMFNEHNYTSNGEQGVFRQRTWIDGKGEEVMKVVK